MDPTGIIEQSFRNPNFTDLQKRENTEVRFFCEAFSLIDSMLNTNILLAFSNLVKETKDGRICWREIPDLFPPEANSTGYVSTLERIFELIEKIVLKGWVTSLRIKSLSDLALQVYKIRKDDISNAKTAKAGPSHLVAATAWNVLSDKLKLLVHYQDTNMKIHEDFQKENLIPNPNSWKVYSGTFFIIFMAVIYSIFFGNGSK